MRPLNTLAAAWLPRKSGIVAGMNPSLAAILQVLPNGPGRIGSQWKAMTLSSHFQPIVSAAEQRVIGYEGLIRAHDANGNALSPAAVLGSANGPSESLYLDWLLRALHLRNFRSLGGDAGLLFINVAPDAAVQDPHFDAVFAKLISHFDIEPRNIVVEITENAAADEAHLIDAVALYKSLGCSVAIDDFGAGSSDVRRLWRLKPDIVKLDRSLVVAAARDDHALRVLGNVVNMMHDCGAKVVLEGVENRLEAQVALETSADFLQGYYFGRPGTHRMPDSVSRRLLAELFPRYQSPRR